MVLELLALGLAVLGFANGGYKIVDGISDLYEKYLKGKLRGLDGEGGYFHPTGAPPGTGVQGEKGKEVPTTPKAEGISQIRPAASATTIIYSIPSVIPDDTRNYRDAIEAMKRRIYSDVVESRLRQRGEDIKDDLEEFESREEERIRRMNRVARWLLNEEPWSKSKRRYNTLLKDKELRDYANELENRWREYVDGIESQSRNYAELIIGQRVQNQINSHPETELGREKKTSLLEERARLMKKRERIEAGRGDVSYEVERLEDQRTAMETLVDSLYSICQEVSQEGRTPLPEMVKALFDSTNEQRVLVEEAILQLQRSPSVIARYINEERIKLLKKSLKDVGKYLDKASGYISRYLKEGKIGPLVLARPEDIKNAYGRFIEESSLLVRDLDGTVDGYGKQIGEIDASIKSIDDSTARMRETVYSIRVGSGGELEELRLKKEFQLWSAEYETKYKVKERRDASLRDLQEARKTLESVRGTSYLPISVSEDDIRRLAYKLWEKAGRPEGRNEGFWFEAERTLKEKEIKLSR